MVTPSLEASLDVYQQVGNQYLLYPGSGDTSNQTDGLTLAPPSLFGYSDGNHTVFPDNTLTINNGTASLDTEGLVFYDTYLPSFAPFVHIWESNGVFNYSDISDSGTISSVNFQPIGTPGPANGGEGGDPTPEPTTLAIWGVGLGLAGAAALRRRKQPKGRWSEKNRQAILQVIEGNR